MKRKDIVEVATVVRCESNGPRGQLVGCSIPLNTERVLLSDLIQVAEELQRAGGNTVFNNDCGNYGRISAIGTGQWPAVWPLRVRCSLQSMRMSYRVEASVSDSDTQRILKIRA